MNVGGKLSLYIFRSVMVFIGVLIIFFSFRKQISDYYYLNNGIVTQGKVIDVIVCSPVVEFTDNQKICHVIHMSRACEGSSLMFHPKVGDVAEILYNADNPKYATVTTINSSDAVYHSENSWKFESISFSIFGLAFIVMAFIPKKFRYN